MFYFYKIRMSVVVALLALLAGCTTGSIADRRRPVPMQLSTSEEIRLGQIVFPRILQLLDGEFDDPVLADYLRQVGERLARASQRPDLPYSFVVVNHSTPNVFALPGGFVAITRGLLNALDSEEQLAAVLSHALGHVAAGHPVQAVQEVPLLDFATAVMAPAEIRDSFGLQAQRAAQLASGLLEMSYSHQQELEADRLGADGLGRAGYDPRSAVQLQEYFYGRIERGVDPAWLTGLFRTHPFSRERIRTLEAYVVEQYERAPGGPSQGGDGTAFARAVGRLRRTQQGYALYDQARLLEERGQFMQATSLYLQAAGAAPEEPLILAALGTLYLKEDDLVSGRQYLGRAVQLDDRYYRSRLGLGYLLLEEKEYAQAVRELEASMILLPTLQGAYLLAGAYEGSQQLGQALEMYQAVVKADPAGRLGRAAAARLLDLETP